jgi:hypothetical protein
MADDTTELLSPDPSGDGPGLGGGKGHSTRTRSRSFGRCCPAALVPGVAACGEVQRMSSSRGERASRLKPISEPRFGSFDGLARSASQLPAVSRHAGPLLGGLRAAEGDADAQ